MMYDRRSPILDLNKNYDVHRGQQGNLACDVSDIVAVRVSEEGTNKPYPQSLEGDTIVAHTNDNHDGTLTPVNDAWNVEGCPSLFDLETNFLQKNISLIPMEDEHGARILVNERYEDTVRAGIQAAIKRLRISRI